MFSRLRIPIDLLLGIVLVTALCGQNGVQQNEKSEVSPSHPVGTRQELQGIPRFGQVSANLYRGGEPTPSALEALRKMGIDVIVDLRRGHDTVEESIVAKLGMKYISIPTRCPFPQDEPIARFLRIVEENREKKIFVHCRLGEDRTGVAIAAYRIAEQGWSAQEADKEVKAFGFGSLHNLICPGLERYVGTFPERWQKDPIFQTLPSRSEQNEK